MVVYSEELLPGGKSFCYYGAQIFRLFPTICKINGLVLGMHVHMLQTASWDGIFPIPYAAQQCSGDLTWVPRIHRKDFCAIILIKSGQLDNIYEPHRRQQCDMVVFMAYVMWLCAAIYRVCKSDPPKFCRRCISTWIICFVASQVPVSNAALIRILNSVPVVFPHVVVNSVTVLMSVLSVMMIVTSSESESKNGRATEDGGRQENQGCKK
jgi:hypothetical protein